MPSIEEKRWYAVYSKPQKEEFAEFSLQQRGLEVFLPKLLFPRTLKKHKQVIPLFPSYLFTRIDEARQYDAVIWAPGVSRVVSFNGTPAPIDDDAIAYLRAAGSRDGLIPARSDLQKGQEVQITDGPFSGLAGIIQDPPGAKDRVRILMNLLNRDVNVEVPLRFVSCGWIAESSKSARSSLLGNLPQAHA
jgi:transcriptional antiterminator RfaH